MLLAQVLGQKTRRSMRGMARKPVSYTHLDVYKRQLSHIAIELALSEVSIIKIYFISGRV